MEGRINQSIVEDVLIDGNFITCLRICEVLVDHILVEYDQDVCEPEKANNEHYAEWNDIDHHSDQDPYELSECTEDTHPIE